MQNTSRFWTLSILIVITVLCRFLLIGIPNAAPIAAVALFGGAYFINKRYAFLVPLVAMLLSDIIMEIAFRMDMQPFRGFHPTMWVIYLSFALIVVMGFSLKNNIKPVTVVGGALAAGILFFLTTNFAIWAIGKGNPYPLDLSGLVLCYTAGLPFLKNTLISNFAFALALFGGFELIKLRFPKIASA